MDSRQRSIAVSSYVWNPVRNLTAHATDSTAVETEEADEPEDKGPVNSPFKTCGEKEESGKNLSNITAGCNGGSSVGVIGGSEEGVIAAAQRRRSSRKRRGGSKRKEMLSGRLKYTRTDTDIIFYGFTSVQSV
jgi:hypothetical protein